MDYTQWSSINRLLSAASKPTWVPSEDIERLASYEKYDQLYWNDPTQFSLRVLEGEAPLYIPNARTLVDTTASFILKGLSLKVPKGDEENQATRAALDKLLDREMFFPRFQVAKHAGTARGDYVMHLTAAPKKAQGSRISLNSVDPSMVFPIYSDDEPDRMVGCHLAQQYYLPDEPDTVYVRKLTYRLEITATSRRVSREEGIYKVSDPAWYSKKPELVKQTIPLGYLDAAITTIPIYWFKNRDWDSQLYGSSELRGLESLIQATSQGSTDVDMALALEGLGVYATDGGRPVGDDGVETDWEVAPGRVMEVPSGSYFRRVEGISSITPAMDHIEYIEGKIFSSAGITDVSLGNAEVAVAQSGIALAIKFMPTLARIEERDIWGSARLKQLFYDWKIWHAVFEGEKLDGEIVPELGDKLPTDRTGRLTELNNMLDRRVISRRYYREEAQKLGYTFPDDIEEDIKADVVLAKVAATPIAQPSEEEPPSDSTLPTENQSNNKNRPNESSGTEATQSLEQQARGGKPQ